MDNEKSLQSASYLVAASAVFERLDVAQATRTEYRWRIKAFVEFIEQRAGELTRDSYLDFKRYLADRNDLSVSTKNKYLVSASILLKELARTGLLPQDITLGVRFFSQAKRHKRAGLTDEEMATLTAALKVMPEGRATDRLRAVVCLLALQGLRQVEVCRLDVDDLDLVAGTALVRGKGRDDKEPVDLHPQTVDALQRYLRSARVADGALFPSWHHSGRYPRLTTRSLRRIVDAALDELGIDKTVHGFRHWFTTRVLKEYQGDLLTVRQFTRHNSTEMLRVYDDRRRQLEDLPRFHNAFKEVSL